MAWTEYIPDDMPDEEGKDHKCCRINSKKNESYLDIIGIFFCEMLGTCVFVFLGCLGCVEGIGNENNLTYNALSFGVAAFIGTKIFYRGSGGHLNPSVTVASLFFRHMKYYMVILYCVAQCSGSLVGFGIIKAILPTEILHTGSYEKDGLCTTVSNPKVPLFTILAMEFLMTTILVLVVCSMWDVRNKKNDHANLKYSVTVCFLVYAGGNFTGCSMNPARSLAPAVWNNTWKLHWVYWVVPIFAGIFSGYFYTMFYGPDCYRVSSAASPIGER